MKAEHKPAKVIYELMGYKIRQIKKDAVCINRWGVYAGKTLVNEKEGYESFEKAKEIIDKLIAGTIPKNLLKSGKKRSY